MHLHARIYFFNFHTHLVYVYPLEVHLEDGDACVGGVLDVPEARVPRVYVDDGHGRRKLPLVAAVVTYTWSQ